MAKDRNTGIFGRIGRVITGNSRKSEVLRFAIVGGLATLLQFLVYILFVDIVRVKAVPSTMISYAISFVFNFILSSCFTFHKRPNASNGIGFVISHLINMGLQTGLVAIFKELVGPSLALLPALAICVPTNYLLVRTAFYHDIFKRKNNKKE